MKQLLYTLFIYMSVAFLTSCGQDELEAILETRKQNITFDGSVLDFLHQGYYEDYAFDSLKYSVDNLSGLQEALQGDSVTLFIATDKSFNTAENILEQLRKTTGKGGRLSLDDLMIEPFDIVDTVITTDPLTSESDTAYVYHHYDYRESLRKLIGKYIFKQSLTTTNCDEEDYPSLFDYRMNIEQPVSDAGGLEGAGYRIFQLVETGGSKLQSSWVRANVVVADIRCANGYVHILSPQHELGFNTITSYFNNYGNENK